MGKHVELTGLTFGELVVVGSAGAAKRGRRLWHCLCSCGVACIKPSEALLSAGTRSCGHLTALATAARARTHGMRRTRTYSCWASMLARCRTPSATGFPAYGAKGVLVCGQWGKFENFLADMGAAPSDAHSIDRKNGSLGYTPENCRWATPHEQSRNTSRNRTVLVNGELVLARDVAARNGVPVATFKSRIYKQGWSLERACGLTDAK